MATSSKLMAGTLSSYKHKPYIISGMAAFQGAVLRAVSAGCDALSGNPIWSGW
jgi:hypothetical protein